MNGHGVAVAAIWIPPARLNEWSLMLVCECGWRVTLGSPCTADFLGELVADHRKQAAGEHPR